MPQAEIDALLVERGRRGQQVVRLKGGDPFVFARGGEEAQALLAAGVPFEVVPGISSAIAAPAYAGIPVTMRHSSTSFTVITGHEDPDKGGEIDWETVARLGGTIVILMGVGRLPKIVARLLAGGLAPDTPAAAVRWGTRPEQHTVRATLATLADHPLEAPEHHRDRRGRRHRPRLVRVAAAVRPAGRRHPGPGAGVGARRAALQRARRRGDRGAGHRDRRSGRRRRRAGRRAVTRLAHLRLGRASPRPTAPAGCSAALHDARDLGGVQVAAIGPGTAEALRAGNIVADLVPERFVAESLLEAFPAPPPARRPGAAGPGRGGPRRAARRAAGRRVAGRRGRGLPHRGGADRRRAAAPRSPRPTSITFTSSSTVDRFVEAVRRRRGAAARGLHRSGHLGAPPASHGLTVDIEATDHTIPGLRRRAR